MLAGGPSQHAARRGGPGGRLTQKHDHRGWLLSQPTLRDLRLDGVARDAVRLLREHQLRVPSQLTVLMRVLTIADGVAGAV